MPPRSELGDDDVAAALLGLTESAPLVKEWWRREYSFRRRELLRRSLDCDPCDENVMRHPSFGLFARDSRIPRAGAAGCVAALLRSENQRRDYLSSFAIRTAHTGSIHLPGTGSYFDPKSRTLFALPAIVSGIEIISLDPILNCYADHIEDARAPDWITLVRDALKVVVELGDHHATTVFELAPVIVPLQQRDGRLVGRAQFEIESGSVTTAVGALYLSRGSNDIVMFAEALVHESFHQLLNAALQVKSFTDSNQPTLISPWKPQPRPPIAVLHGIVAFSAVRRFWLDIARHRPCRRAHAVAEAQRRGEQIRVACETLNSSGVLTAAGYAVISAALGQLVGLSN